MPMVTTIASYNAWGDYYDKAPNYGTENDMYNEIDKCSWTCYT